MLIQVFNVSDVSRLLIGKLPLDASGDGAQLVIGLRNRHARFDQRNRPQVMIAVILLHLRLDDERRPHLAAAVGKLETPGHYADYLERFVIEHDPFADYLRVAAEARLPEGVPEHDHLRVPFLVLAAPEHASQLWLRAERVEEGRRNSIARVTLRRPIAGQDVIAIAHDDHFL